MDDWMAPPPKKPGLREIPIAPILDMLVAIIFFLLLSTSFTDFTMQAVPPAQVNTITDPVVPPPLSPKLFLVRRDEGLWLILRWAGNEPGQIERRVGESQPGQLSKNLVFMAEQVVADFKQRYPNEGSLQLAFGPAMTYQDVISVMDGAKMQIPDLVLLSHMDAIAVTEAMKRE